MIHWFENSFLAQANLTYPTGREDVIVLAYVTSARHDDYFLVISEKGQYHQVYLKNLYLNDASAKEAFSLVRGRNETT